MHLPEGLTIEEIKDIARHDGKICLNCGEEQEFTFRENVRCMNCGRMEIQPAKELT